MMTRPLLLIPILALAACTKPAPEPAGPAAPTKTVAVVRTPYVCTDGRIVSARYPDSTTAQVEIAGVGHRLTLARSASGARYVGDALQWWTKGDEGRLSALKPGEDVAADPGVNCVPPARAPVEPPAPGTPGGLPDDRTPLDERPFSPESAQGAANVVQTYYALVESGRVAEAAKLRVDGKAEDLTSLASLHAQSGGPGPVEGAAGSLFVEVPVVLYGRYATGAEYHASGKAVLRRVNGVPGATAEQLRWRIERIETTVSGSRPTG